MPSKFTEYMLTLAMGLILIVSITMSFHGMYESVEEEVIQQELEAMTQRVAQYVIDVISIGQEAEYAINWMIEIEIELPTDLRGHLYHISAEESSEGQYFESIHGTLLTQSDISAQVKLSPIIDNIQIHGSFQSIFNKHTLQYYPLETTIEFVDQ